MKIVKGKYNEIFQSRGDHSGHYLVEVESENGDIADILIPEPEVEALQRSIGGDESAVLLYLETAYPEYLV